MCCVGWFRWLSTKRTMVSWKTGKSQDARSRLTWVVSCLNRKKVHNCITVCDGLVSLFLFVLDTIQVKAEILSSLFRNVKSIFFPENLILFVRRTSES